MYEIKNNPLWSPTSEYIQLTENFGGIMRIE